MHLNDEGYKLLFRALTEEIVSAWSELHLARDPEADSPEDSMKTSKDQWRHMVSK